MLMLVWLLLLSTDSGKGTTTMNTEDKISVIFGGDVDFSRLTRYLHHKKNCSYVDSLKRLNNSFRSADFTMINLETTIGRPEGDVNNYTATGLWSDVSSLSALTNNGIKYVTLANNHMQDFGDKQTRKTMKYVGLYGIKYSGIVNEGDKQEPLIMQKNGLRIGVLSYCDLTTCAKMWRGLKVGPAILKVESVVEEVKSLRSNGQCDIVVLFLHWGLEYASITDTGVIDIIKNLTKAARIDLIVGSHPHVTQKHWYTGKTLVATSLGNLFFMPHNLANHNFNDRQPPRIDIEKPGTHKQLEKVWYKQMKVMQDGTNFGRLLKVVFNKEGIVIKQSKYIGTQIFATNNHCLATKIKDNAKWVPICGVDDRQCTGTSNCNFVECGKNEPLPPGLSSSPRKRPKYLKNGLKETNSR